MPLLLALGACSEPTEDASPVDETAVDETAVVVGYHAYWDALLVASDPPRPADPALADHAVGDELDRARQTLQQRVELQQVARGDYRHHEVVRSTDVDTATLDDCLKVDVVVIGPDGSRTRQPRGPFAVTVTMQQVADRWLVAAVEAGGFSCSNGRPPAAMEDPR